jgi:hypothetical protein
MSYIIEKIVTILNGYGYGKVLAPKRKSKSGGKGRARDLVSISEEARKRCNSGEDAVAPRHIGEVYKK